MNKYKIVKGKKNSDKTPKRYMKIDTGVKVSYHNLKERKKTWSTRYGPYNTIKQKPGSITFYDVGLECNIKVIEEYDFQIDESKISIGWNF